MRNESHTLIGTLRYYVNEWRKREGWSRETVVQAIVESHYCHGADRATQIHFDPPTRDAFERQKANADRLFRWLDDDSKDTNLLPANFIPSLLRALPADLRLRFLDGQLAPLGLQVATRKVDLAKSFDAKTHLVANLKEASEAATALAQLGATSSVEELMAARTELMDEANAATEAVWALNAAIHTMTTNPSREAA